MISQRGESVSRPSVKPQGKDCAASHRPQDSPDPQTADIMSQEDLNQITDLVTARTIFATKEVLTSEETALYMGISKSYLYKLTMRREIPHYKPTGKMCYFDRREVEAWLKTNRVVSDTELTNQAAAYCSEKGGAA